MVRWVRGAKVTRVRAKRRQTHPNPRRERRKGRLMVQPCCRLSWPAASARSDIARCHRHEQRHDRMSTLHRFQTHLHQRTGMHHQQNDENWCQYGHERQDREGVQDEAQDAVLECEARVLRPHALIRDDRAHAARSRRQAAENERRPIPHIAAQIRSVALQSGSKKARYTPLHLIVTAKSAGWNVGECSGHQDSRNVNASASRVAVEFPAGQPVAAASGC